MELKGRNENKKHFQLLRHLFYFSFFFLIFGGDVSQCAVYRLVCLLVELKAC